MRRMGLLASLALAIAVPASAGAVGQADYRLLATNKTSTMEHELNEAARDGYLLAEAIGGVTEHGGRELVAIMERHEESDGRASREYLVLATNRTGTMQRELDDAARRGFLFAAQTVFETAFGGQEVVVIMERNLDGNGPVCEYALLATNETSTMDRELFERGIRGFLVKGISVSETAFGGREVVVVMERCQAPSSASAAPR